MIYDIAWGGKKMYKNNFIKNSLVIVTILLFIGTGAIPSIDGDSVTKNTGMSKQINMEGFFQGNVEFTYDVDDVPDTIKPEEYIAKVDIYINYFVSGLGAKYIIPFFTDKTVAVELSIEDVPEWCSTSISPTVVYPQVRLTKSDTPEHAVLSIEVTTKAPAFQSESIEITAKASTVKGRFDLLTFVKSAENKMSVEFKPGYYSDFQYEYPTYINMLPNETKKIPIKITSSSNARSKIQFEFLNSPGDWSTSINSEILLGAEALGEDAADTVNFTVHSPGEIGYHNDVEQFIVRVKTMAAGHPDEGIDNSTILQFTVRSRGNIDDPNPDEESSPGFESILVIMAIFIILIIVMTLFWRRKI